MKKIYKSILFGAIAAIATIFNWSCDNNNDKNTGTPYISYIRVTNQASADSLLVAGGQGQLIAIVGGNLQTVREIWLNDRQAYFSPVYVTNTTILVNLPSELPDVVTNQLKLIFADGYTLLHDFKLTVNPPAVNTIDCEYVAEGDSAVIHGAYFYLPITVTFPSAEGSLINGLTVSSENGDISVNSANNLIHVKVPAGAQPGQLIVASNFGKTASNFWFRDNRNIIQGFDSSDNPGTDGTVISKPGAGDPPLINGKYCRIVKTMGDWAWTQVYATWGPPYYPVPDAAILHPSDYYFKFEVCTTKPFDANGVRVWVTDPAVSNKTGPKGDGAVFYNWWPPFDSQGKWQTVSIPFEDVASALQSWFPGGVTADGKYFCLFVYCEAGTLQCDMSYDNFRIVPKIILTDLGE